MTRVGSQFPPISAPRCPVCGESGPCLRCVDPAVSRFARPKREPSIGEAAVVVLVIFLFVFALPALFGGS